MFLLLARRFWHKLTALVTTLQLSSSTSSQFLFTFAFSKHGHTLTLHRLPLSIKICVAAQTD